MIDDPHDAPALAAAMARMLDRGYLRDAGAAARAAGTRWTFEHHYQALLTCSARCGSLRRAA